jgi:hypothetical protein
MVRSCVFWPLFAAQGIRQVPMRTRRCRSVPASYLPVPDSAFVMDKLMDALVRDAQQTGGISRAHLQLSTAQQPHGASCRECRAVVFLICPLPQHGVSADCLCGRRRQLYVIDQPCGASIRYKQLHRFANTTAGFVDRPALRVTAAHFPDRCNPPTRFVSFVSDVIGSHDFLSDPFPRQGSRSRSMERNNPGPRSSPEWTGSQHGHGHQHYAQDTCAADHSFHRQPPGSPCTLSLGFRQHASKRRFTEPRTKMLESLLEAQRLWRKRRQAPPDLPACNLSVRELECLISYTTPGYKRGMPSRRRSESPIKRDPIREAITGRA